LSLASVLFIGIPHLHVHAATVGDRLLREVCDAVFSRPKYLLATRRMFSRA
jgi:hypothetical protein